MAEAKKELGITAEAVRALIELKIISGEKINGRWQISRLSVDNFNANRLTSKLPASDDLPPIPFDAPQIVPRDTGILQITAGLTGASAVIMTLLPSFVANISPFLKVLILGISLLVAAISLIASLVMLGQFLEDAGLLAVDHSKKLYGLEYVSALFSRSTLPYRFLAVALFVLVAGLFIVSILIIFLSGATP